MTMRNRIGFRLAAITTGLFLLSPAFQCYAGDEAPEARLAADAQIIVKRFGSMLKPRLLEAMASGGPGHAVDVCAIEAPKIAADLGQETGWIVKRVSLKPRNLANASADAFEARILRKFDQRQQAGESPATISHAEMINGQFRFMKAQGTEALGLSCHGESVTPSVLKVIAEHYPEDVATGYSLGQVRGAFSLTKKPGVEKNTD